MRDLTQHLTTRADDNHAPPVTPAPKRGPALPGLSGGCQALVRFFALLRIKPHAPLLVRVPVNSFEFYTCVRTAPNSLESDTWCSSFTAWTTRVSNPVCYPRFRASVSVSVQKAAFATGVPPNIYAFHRYTRNSAFPSCTQALQFAGRTMVRP